MKSVIALFFMFAGFAHATPASTYRCECYNDYSNDSFIIYVIETAGREQNWLPLESRPTQYDDMKSCTEAAAKNETCLSLAAIK